MTRATVIIRARSDREKVARWAMGVPDGSRVEFKSPRRSLPQNDRFWAMATDIANQYEHFGRKYSPEEWRTILMHAWGREIQFAPSLDGKTFVPFIYSSADLSKEEMTSLIEFMFAWGAEHGVVFHDDRERAA